MTFYLEDFKDYETTITAELKGQVTNVPEKDYTGIPVSIIIEKSNPKTNGNKADCNCNRRI